MIRCPLVLLWMTELTLDKDGHCQDNISVVIVGLHAFITLQVIEFFSEVGVATRRSPKSHALFAYDLFSPKPEILPNNK